MSKINIYIEEKTKLINSRLEELVKEDDSLLQNRLLKAANYALHSGGKRLRPLLVLATVDTFKEDSNAALDIACAIELIHTYSLIHDDLPCMDNDDVRRNKPSLHKAFSEWEALLTGDFLLSYAFEIIAKTKNLSDEKKTKITSIIAEKIGAKGMLGGQFVDLLSENKKVDWHTVNFMHMNKSANLFVAALQCGGVIADANEKEMTGLTKFGEHIGLAFQIVDDILDASSEKMQNKATAVTVLGVEKSKEKIKQLYDRGILYLSALSFPPPLLKDLAFKLVKRTY